MFRSDTRLILSHTSAAARLKLGTYFMLGVRRNHCSRFSAIGNKMQRKREVSYHCFMLTEENFLNAAMVKCW